LKKKFKQEKLDNKYIEKLIKQSEIVQEKIDKSNDIKIIYKKNKPILKFIVVKNNSEKKINYEYTVIHIEQKISCYFVKRITKKISKI
jgi:hypothetical protein